MRILLSAMILFAAGACDRQAPAPVNPEQTGQGLSQLEKEAAERHANIDAMKHNPSVADPSLAGPPINPKFVIPHDADKPMHDMHHAR